MIRLNHIGIAVAQVPNLARLFAILGLKSDHTEDVPDQGVKAHFLPMPVDGKGAHLEFLEVLDPKGTVSQFIQKRGPGIHHLSFSVAKGELERLSSELRVAGYRLVYEKPRAGAHKMMINFIHPASAGGMLIELMEPSGEPK